MKINPISQEQIDQFNECLSLDAATGRLYWRKKIASKIVVGAEAGSQRKDGYKTINLFGHSYLAHRIVFAMLNGHCDNEIDHINGDPSDNRPENIRAVTRSQQNMNRGVHCNNTSGHKGVYWFKPKGYWQARIKVAGKYISLGYFRSIENAVEAYNAGAEKYHNEYRRAY
jgi:hypothetical protein